MPVSCGRGTEQGDFVLHADQTLEVPGTGRLQKESPMSHAKWSNRILYNFVVSIGIIMLKYSIVYRVLCILNLLTCSHVGVCPQYCILVYIIYIYIIYNMCIISLIGFMYGMLTYIHRKCQPNVGKYIPVLQVIYHTWILWNSMTW